MAKLEKNKVTFRSKLLKKLLPSNVYTPYSRFIDRTYWKWVREHRRCDGCGIKWTYDNKVNYGIAYDSSNKTYHKNCLPK